jgi:hypothetical protein
MGTTVVSDVMSETVDGSAADAVDEQQGLSAPPDEWALSVTRTGPIRDAASCAALDPEPMAKPGDLRFWVRKARGNDDVVTVFEDEGGQVVVERAVRSWPDLSTLGVEYGVPPERWMIDDDAREILDANF